MQRYRVPFKFVMVNGRSVRRKCQIGRYKHFLYCGTAGSCFLHSVVRRCFLFVSFSQALSQGVSLGSAIVSVYDAEIANSTY